MRQENGLISLLDHSPSGATKNGLHHPRMAVGTHHDKVRTLFLRTILNALRNLVATRWKLRHGYRTAMMAEPCGHICAWVCTIPLSGCHRVKTTHDDLFCRA